MKTERTDPVSIVNTKISSSQSYRQIFKASAVTGGSQVVSLLLGMLRVKASATFLGTAGVGLLGNFVAIQNVISTLAGLGIQSSGVRSVAEAAGRQDEKSVGDTATILRRVSWLTGFLGAVLTVTFCMPISLYTFGSFKYSGYIAALGITILLGNIATGQAALLQGLRRIGSLARTNIAAAALATAASVPVYYSLGIRGILPVLLLTGIITLITNWYFTWKLALVKSDITWKATLKHAQGMIALGLSIMISRLAFMLTDYAVRAFITHKMGLGSVGIFGAAFSLSGILVNFILAAMGTDFYPRLVAAGTHPEINRIVNQQTEVAIFIALPGLVATIFFAPALVRTFYSQEFSAAVPMLQWFVLGCFGRIISWPLGFLILALGRGKAYLFSEIFSNFALLGLMIVLIGKFGLIGASMAYMFLYFVYFPVVYIYAYRKTNFFWSRNTTIDALAGVLVLFVSVNLQDIATGRVLWFLQGCMAVLLISIALAKIKFLRKAH